MKLKLFAMAALAVLTMASCSKDDAGNGDGPKVPEGKPTSFKLAFTMPQGVLQNPQTRVGTDHEGTAAESKIESIEIWVFNSDSTKSTTGGYTTRTISQFEPKGNNVYEMKDAIQTTSGDKRVYVGTNLPLGLGGDNYDTETDLLDKVADVVDFQNETNGNLTSLVMFGAARQTFVVADYGDNIVNLDLYRNVARVITTSEISGNTVTKDFGATGDLSMSIKGYFIAQDAHKSYLVQHYQTQSDPTSNLKSLIMNYTDAADFGQVVNKYDPSLYPNPPVGVYTNIVPDASNEAGRAGLKGYYMGENITNSFGDVARNGNTTYAFVQTQLKLTNGAKVDAGNIVYNGTAINAGDDFILVRMIKADGTTVEDYICSINVEDPVGAPGYREADAVGNKLIDDNPGATVKLYEYKKGYVYYRIWLTGKQTGKDQYNVYRNQFIHLDIEDIKIESGKFGGGYPGDKTNPEVPIDPNDKDNENNPNPKPDPLPIDEQDATMKVNIQVKPWSYVKNGITMQ